MRSFLKNPVKIVFAILIVCFIALSSIGLGNLAAPSSYYQTGELEKSSYLDAVCYKLDTEDFSRIKYCYVSFGSASIGKSEDETVGLKLRCATSETSNMTSVTVKSDNLKNGFESLSVSGWNLVADIDRSINYKYFLITCSDALKINEVVFVGKKADETLAVIPLTSVGSGARAKDDTTSIEKSLEFARTTEAKAKANVLIDEQSKFHISAIGEDGVYTSSRNERLTETEYYTVESIRNVVSGRSFYIDKTTNPLGQYVMAIGTAIFGYNTFGVRVMPLVFTVATIILLFFLGKLLFGKEIEGLLFAFLFAVGGYALSTATLGVADPIFAFFIILSFMAFIKFYKKGISKKSPAKSYLNLLLGGVSFAVAFAVKSQAVYFAAGIIALFVIGLIRQYNAYRQKRFIAEGDEISVLEVKSAYKQKLLNSLVIGGVGIIILPIVLIILTYLIANSAYGGLYGNYNVFNYAFTNLSQSFTAKLVNTAETYAPVSFAINYGWLSIGGNKFVFGNIVLTFINLFSLVFGTATIIGALIESRKSGIDKETKSALIMPFVFFAAMLISWVILNSAVCGTETALCYLVPSILASGITITIHNYLTVKDVKAVIKTKKIGISVTGIITAILLVAITVVFALSVPAFIGLSVPEGLYSFNVLYKAALTVA